MPPEQQPTICDKSTGDQEPGARRSAEEAAGDPGHDEEEAREGCAGGQNLAVALPNFIHFAQHRLLGPLRRPRTMVGSHQPSKYNSVYLLKKTEP